jgi:hypothetical protein
VIRSLLLSAALFAPLTVTPVAAQEKSEAALFTALAARGCSIAEREMSDVLGPMGFDFAFVSDTLTRLLLEEEASVNADNELHLPASVCPPASPAPSPRDLVLQAFAKNGCALTETGLREAAPGLSDAALLAVLKPYHDAGDLSVSRGRATLGTAACTKTE